MRNTRRHVVPQHTCKASSLLDKREKDNAPPVYRIHIQGTLLKRPALRSR